MGQSQCPMASNCRSRPFLYLCIGFFGIGMIVMGFMVVFYFDDLVDNYLKSKLLLTSDSILVMKWAKPPIRPSLKLYFFDVTNPNGFLAGEKPKLKEKGPYVYEEIWEKINLKWSENETKLSYEQKKTYYFNSKLSIGPETDKVTIPNIPMITAASQVRKEGILIRLALGSMLQLLQQEPFITVSIKDLVWGYEHPLIKLGNDVLPSDKKLPHDQFGFFVGKNQSTEGIMQILTGLTDVNSIGKIQTFNGDKKLNFWKGDTCNAIRGTDGSIFSPNISKNQTLYVFSRNVCRSLPLVFKEEVIINGISGYRFVPPSNVFGTPEENPANTCFCGESCSLPSGLFNISVCQFNSPLLLSWPHFFEADDVLLKEVEGLKPIEEKHQLYINVQPKLGNGLGAIIRSQINIMMNEVKGVKPAKGLRDIVFPILWMEEGVEKIEDEATIALLKKSVNMPVIIRDVTYPILFAGGLLVLILLLIYSLKSAHKRKDKGSDCTIPLEKMKNCFENKVMDRNLEERS